MKSKGLLFLLFFQVFSVGAQVKHDYNWSIGEGTVPDNTVDSGMDINFNTNPVSITSMWRDIDIKGTNATMSDADGNLLFYTNGCKIFNADHVLMENGNNINAGEVNDIQCPDDQVDGAYTVTNGILALPDPGSDSLYYLFHQRLVYLYNPFDVKVDRLLYSVINMNEDGGKGAVIEKDITIIPDSLWPGEVTAVKHANGNDWWILNYKTLTDTCYTLLLTADTIEGPFKQRIGLPMTKIGRTSGQSCFSPDGTMYATYNKEDQLFLYDFNRATGLLSNFQVIEVADTIILGGLAFSPNSRYLYVSKLFELYQFDLWATDIEASKILIGVYDGFQDPFSTYFSRMQLGPDCRIYMSATSGHYSWHIINKPDEPGLACDLRQHSFELPYSNFRAMPYFPNYRLGTTPTYPCDSTIVVNLTTSTTTIPPIKTAVKLYPNPVKSGGVLTVSLQKGVNGKLLLYDLLGQLVLSQELTASAAMVEVRLPEGMEAGIYFYALRGEEGEVVSGKVVVE